MRTALKIITCAAILSLIGACGFHIRTTSLLPSALQPLYIGGKKGGGPLAQALRIQLAGNDTSVTTNPATANYQLLILEESQEQRIVSLDRRGLVAELGLITEIAFELHDRDGKRVLGPQTIQNRRTIVNNPDNATTTNEEVRLVSEDMTKTLAGQVVRRLAAYANQPHPAEPAAPAAAGAQPN